MNGINLLLSFFKGFSIIIWIFILENWRPFFTTVVKMSIIALISWGICQCIPHDITFLNHITYLGWLVLICLFRLITLKYDDFDIEEPLDDGPIEAKDDEDPNAIEEPQYQPLGNIIRKDDNESTGSTRE